MVLNRECVVQKGRFCVWEDLAFNIVDFTFHGQWEICQVPPPDRGSCACLGSHPSLANRTGVC